MERKRDRDRPIETARCKERGLRPREGHGNKRRGTNQREIERRQRGSKRATGRPRETDRVTGRTTAREIGKETEGEPESIESGTERGTEGET